MYETIYKRFEKLKKNGPSAIVLQEDFYRI